MDKITAPVFVVITTATRERIHRNPQIGSANKEVFPFRTGDLGLIVPVWLERIEQAGEAPWGEGPAMIIDPRHGLWGTGPDDDDIAVLVSKSPLGWENPHDHSDYRLVWLSEDEFAILCDTTNEIALVAEYKRISAEKGLGRLNATSKAIQTMSRFLKAAMVLFENPFEICIEPAARKIDDGMVKAESDNCKLLHQNHLDSCRNAAAARTRVVGA